MDAAVKESRPGLAHFYGDMEKLLRQQLAQDAQNKGVRLKLMEVYYETGRRHEFLNEAHTLSKNFDFKAQASEWSRVLSMARMLGIKDDLFSRNSGDMIEFVAAPKMAGGAGAAEYQRIGEDDRYRGYFQGMAMLCENELSEPRFLAEFDHELIRVANRPSSLEDAKRLSRAYKGAQIFFKREDLSPRGTQLNIAILGQAMLAQRLKRSTLITGTVNGFRGVATAAVAARLGLRAVVCMDRVDMDRFPQQVFQMRLHGADLREVDKSRLTGNDVRIAALDLCAANPDTSFLILGLDAGPPPYPMITREFVAAIGRECVRQVKMQAKRAPDLMVARGGTTADAIGFFEPFLSEPSIRMACVAGRQDVFEKTDAQDLFDPSLGRQDKAEHLLMALATQGLEQPEMVREHAFLKTSGRVEYIEGDGAAARQAIMDLARFEGVVPAIETAHVIGWACQEAAKMKPEQAVVVMFAESSEKDVLKINRALGDLSPASVKASR